MNIDRHNYEEFFILYLDNELSASDRQQVEDFAETNPDLKAELDLLMQSRLIPETDITFAGKADLFKHEAIGEETTSMLLYMDNEMSAAQKKDFEQWLSSNPAAQKELGAYQQTRLQAEHIAFPHKESLYRQEERRVVTIRWWRMAAAAVLLLGISTAAFMFNHERSIRAGLAKNNSGKTTQDSANGIAQVTAKENSKKNDTFAVQPEQSVTGTNTDHNNQFSSASSSGANVNVSKGATVNTSGTSHERSADQNIVHADNVNAGTESTGFTAVAETMEEPAFVVNKRQGLSNSLAYTSAIDNNDLQADPSLTIHKQINPLPNVTQEDDQPLDIMNEPGKKNRLRGFFRKITRTFEKTTNIKATDGEDRLLVGGLAIKF